MISAGTVFVLDALQHWGQPDSKRIAAVQRVLDEAGFDATAQSWPVGGRWPKACTGKDGEAATVWLANLTATMPRGKFEHEEDHVNAAIARKAEGG